MYMSLLPNSTPSYQEPERPQLPSPSSRGIQHAVVCVLMGERVLPVKFGLVKKRWSVSRTNNDDLPTEASPMITNFST
jgi:hypothetical protein